MTETIKQMMQLHPDMEFHLYDSLGIWGELPLTETNTAHIPDDVQIIGNVVKIWIG